jgi:hypothetical protein
LNPFPAQEARVVGAEAERRGVERRRLGDHVEAVQHHHPALRIGDPTALVAERASGDRAGRRGRGRDGCSRHDQADEQAPTSSSVESHLLPPRPAREAA